MNESLGFIIDNLGSFWRGLPAKDQLALLDMWYGYAQLASEGYAYLYQTDYSKSLKDIQTTINHLWKRYVLWHYYDLDYTPAFIPTGLASTKFEWQATKEIDCTFELKGTWDKNELSLVSQADQYSNLYWQAKINPTDGVGGLIGYFNTLSKDLTNSIAFGWGDGSLIGLICDSDGNLNINTLTNSLTGSNNYNITATYLASGGELNIKLMDENLNLLDSLSTTFNCLPFPYSEPYTLTISEATSGVTGAGFEVDTFGIGNINNKNYIDDFKAIFSSSTGTSKIYDLGYMDPTVDTRIQSIPTLQSELDDPIMTLTQGVTGDYLLINSSLHFFNVLPALYLWGHTNYYDNEGVENNFGFMVRYNKDPETHTDAEYLNGIKGLWHSYLFGPTVSNIETGLSIIARQPFAARAGTITDIYDVDATYGKIIITPTDGTNNLEYTYEKALGLAINPDTGELYKTGDTVEAYQVLTSSLDVVDYKIAPYWWTYHLVTEPEEVQKYKSFGVRLKQLHLSPNNLTIMVCNFINHIKPSDTRAWFMKENDHPLFIIGDYGHVPYIEVSVIGDQSIYLPLDFIYEDIEQEFLYTRSRLTGTGTRRDGTVPDIRDITINVNSPIIYNPHYSYPSTTELGSGVAWGSLVFTYGDASFYSTNNGVVWNRVLDLTGGAANVDLGPNPIVQSGSTTFMGSTYTYYPMLGYDNSRIRATIIAGQALGEVPAYTLIQPVTVFDQVLDIYDNHGVSPVSAKIKEISASLNEEGGITFTGQGLAVGIKNSDSTKLIVYQIDVISRSEPKVEQLNSTGYYTLKNYGSTQKIGQNITLTQAAPNGMEITVWPARIQFPSGSIYLDIYSGHYSGGVFSLSLIETSPDVHDAGEFSPEFYGISYTTSTPYSAGNYSFVLRAASADATNYALVDAGTVATGVNKAFYANPYTRNQLNETTSADIGGGDRYSQLFTPDERLINGKFKVTLKIGDASGSLADEEYWLTLYAVTKEWFGAPYNTYAITSAALLGTSSKIAGGDIPVGGGSFTEFDFTFSHVDLALGQLYAINLMRTFAERNSPVAYLKKSNILDSSIPVYFLLRDDYFPHPPYSCTITDWEGKVLWWPVSEANSYPLYFKFSTENEGALFDNEALHYQIICPLVFPDDYTTITEICNIDLLSGEELIGTVQDNLDLFYLGDDEWKMFVPITNTNDCYVLYSNDNGLSWITDTFDIVDAPSNLSFSRFYCSAGIIYCYYKDPSSSKDYVIASKTDGDTWSTPYLLSTSSTKYSTRIYPCFTEDNDGNIWLVGVDSLDRILAYRMIAR